jgi:hypothetical protein
LTDVLVVSLGSTAGLRFADSELAASLERAGASVEVCAARPPGRRRTLAWTDLAWARAARVAAREAISRVRPRVIVYSSSGAALLWPEPGAIRFDAPAAGNRPGLDGVWQRPAERRRFAAARLLVPWSEGGLAEAAAITVTAPALVVPVPAEASGPPAAARDVAAVTYGANPEKKGLARVLAAWAQARREGEELVVLGAGGPIDAPGVRSSGLLAPDRYRALLRRARVFVTAPAREDYGIAQLDALADGAMLVTTEAPGPYAALPIARAADPRLVGDDLAGALRAALDDPGPGYAERAAEGLRPYRRAEVDAVVAERLLPALLG